MKHSIYPVASWLILSISCACVHAAPSSPQADAARGLIARVLPPQADAFVVEIIPADAGHDVFEIESKDGKIVLRGNNGVSVASALNWYLKYHCQCDISWCGTQLDLPAKLPAIPEKERQVSPHKYRTFFNYCTFGYSMPWWGWKEWERAIDVLAMQGYNMPLAMTGMEAIWYNALLRVGLTDLEARSFLSAPAHLPWQFMQNHEGVQGPLPKSWIDSHTELARKMINRQRELGMTPIQQGFSGHIPRLFKVKFPTAQIALQPDWAGMDGVMQLDPLDPLFQKFGRIFIEEQIKLFGTSHLYAADPFHESKPPRSGEAYLTAVGRNIFKVMTDVDPDAVWIMQGWTNYRPIIESVPKSRLRILSIAGAKNGAYWGYPFLNCRYNNFGNRTNLHGDLKNLATNPFAATIRAENSNCIGTGLMMEGIFQNPVYLQLSADLLWRTGPVEITPWLHGYARRRYGAPSSTATSAWDLLLATAYVPGTGQIEYSSIIAARPALNCKKSGPNEGFRIPYDPHQLARAWELLLQDRDKLKTSDGYQFDVVDVGRQVLSNYAQSLHRQVVTAFNTKDQAALAAASQQFQELLCDLDTLCATRPELNLGVWVAAARRWGLTEQEQDLYERSTCTLVSVWGFEKGKDPQIFDYAWREWSGLIRSFYLPRWQIFHQMLAKHLADGTTYSEDNLPLVHGRETFRANAFYSKMADWEFSWE